MTLSESICLGATKRPRCEGRPFKALGIPTQAVGEWTVASCLVGAAFEAYTGTIASGVVQTHVYATVRRAFPVATRMGVACPECTYFHDDHLRPIGELLDVAVHGNDFHHWSREQGADFIRTFEETR